MKLVIEDIDLEQSEKQLREFYNSNKHFNNEFFNQNKDNNFENYKEYATRT